MRARRTNGDGHMGADASVGLEHDGAVELAVMADHFNVEAPRQRYRGMDGR